MSLSGESGRSTLIAVEARITSAEQISSVTEANRAGWNLIADRRPAVPVERFRRGEVCLEDFERRLAGDVTGRRVLQLACSSGDEVLSWAVLGATAIGVDISDVAIATARARAAEAGLAADFRRPATTSAAAAPTPSRTTPSARPAPAARPARHRSRRSSGRSATS